MSHLRLVDQAAALPETPGDRILALYKRAATLARALKIAPKDGMLIHNAIAEALALAMGFEEEGVSVSAAITEAEKLALLQRDVARGKA